MKVYEAVAAGLVAEGCDTMFGLMGDGNMSLWGALGRAGKVTMISAGNEAGAVAMADGYSRATGKIGVATITCGPGLTQVGTSLTIAVRHRTQLVLIIGQIPARAKNKLQSMDQRRFVEACGARFHDLSGVDDLADEIAEAFYAARVHRCPVVLNLDMNLQERSFDWEFAYQPSITYLPPRAGTPSEEALMPVLEKLAQCERPVFVAGRGAQVAGAKAEILRLAEQVGALLATSLQSKGWFAGEEYDIGICGAFAAAPAEQLLAEADFVLGIGAELGYYTTEGGMIFPSAEIARIDIQPAPEEIGFLPGQYICGDAKQTVAALCQMLEARRIRKAGFRTAATRAMLQAPEHVFAKPADGLDPRLLARTLSSALPKGCVVTCGAGHFLAFPAMYLTLPEDAEIRFSYHFGAVGQGLPLAIGIGMANRGRPHVAIEGDGSLMMNIQELFTVARFKLQLVLIVWNDAGFGAEVHKLRAKGFDWRLAQWQSPDYAAISRGFGGDGVRIQSEAELGPAIERGLKTGGLFVIDARVSPSTMADSYAKVHFGEENRAPLLRRLARNA